MSAQIITLLGSTGSVGLNTLQVVRTRAREFRIGGLAAASNRELLDKQIREFKPKAVFIKDEKSAKELQEKFGKKLKVFSNKDTLDSFTAYVNADILVAATSGTSALLSVLQAISKGKRVALANKEILVMAGGIVMNALKKNKKASLVPVDSEHSAIFQCLQGESHDSIEKIILTGTGGPLRELDHARFKGISKEVVINHPKWKMGKKISVDSATLMNKGLEIIEASWLFKLPIQKIEVLIHPEAIIHSMVQFMDGAVIAQLGITDMKLPIQYALSYPKRLDVSDSLKLDFKKNSVLHFLEPDTRKFPCLGLAYEAAKKLGSAPCVLSAADEVCVNAFLDDQIDFVEIPEIIEQVLSKHKHIEDPNLKDIQSAQDWALEEAKRLCLVR